jgi:transketolase
MKNFQSIPKVIGLFGDGEAQEGQVHEMIHFANKYQLDNLCLFVDYNDVQLSASLDEIMPIDVSAMFKAGGWQVIELDGHDYQAMWQAVSDFYSGKYAGKPVLLAAKTIMGKGIEFMEPDGLAKKASWHGKAPSAEMTMEALSKIEMTTDETAILDSFRANNVAWKPAHANFVPNLTPMPEVKTGEATVYEAGTVTDCRSAYGKALLELARLNKNVVALTADLRESVKTDGVYHEFPERHLELGIAEQNMVSVAGGLSLAGFIPFASTFGAFMSSRAKDQARVNDINQCNVKMVATHCGLSVGEDGPTHQAIDDMTSFLGMFNTQVIDPADPNQCDRIIRFIASHYGNFYVRMGRHKFAVLTKEDGTPFYDANYQFEYGKADIIRSGASTTLVASGACVGEALKAIEQAGMQGQVELIALSSLKQIDSTILDSLRKTGKLITVEDHNPQAGIGTMIAQAVALNGITLSKFEMLGVKEYQLSGTQADLYQAAKIDAAAIQEALIRA